MGIDDNKGTGPNSIPTKLLKLILPTFSDLLSNLINECLTSGIFPQCLKHACIKPIHKKDSKLLTGNYRPISLLSNISKIFEKVIHNRLYNFLESNKTLFKHQFGFRKKHNTNHAIIALTESIREALDQNHYSVGVFIDLQKAFDTVEHSILLKKLNHYGIRGTVNTLLKSYLENRKHNVDINGHKSSYIDCKHGVPQGSVLGPLLFLIYINDLNKCIKHSTTYHFADDTSLLCSGKSMKKINKQINEDLRNVVHWLRCNKISLNASKTEIIIFKNKNKPIKKNVNFRLSGQKIFPSKKVKYLGIIIDENLSWKPHISLLLTKLSRATGILSKTRHYLQYKPLVSIYHSLFQSHLNYCIQTFGHVTNENMDKIRKLQNKALRIMHFKNNRDPVLPLFQQSGILPIDKQLILKNCLFAFDQQKKNLPTFFDSFCKREKQRHSYLTRYSKYKLEISLTKTITYGSNNIKNTIAKQWNNTISELKIDITKVSKTVLRNRITHLLSKPS